MTNRTDPAAVARPSQAPGVAAQSGKLILGTPGILKNLGAARPELLEVRVNGAKSVRPDPRSLIVDFSSPALDVEITVAPAA